MVAIDLTAREKFHHLRSSDGLALLSLATSLVVADLIHYVPRLVQMPMH